MKNLIIGKQFEDSENLQKVLNIIREKKMKMDVVEAGDKINIESNVDIDILWPNSLNAISENAINNNSIVCKFNYKEFSMLFTGDIEEIAEEKILQKINANLLKADILKVGHHGSNTSSIELFIQIVKPQIALIGVGKNNKFGHPNDEVLERLKELGSKIYRTDVNGEIGIIVDKQITIKINKMIK